eukprot:1740967-Rhodomonas_salina.1
MPIVKLVESSQEWCQSSSEQGCSWSSPDPGVGMQLELARPRSHAHRVDGRSDGVARPTWSHACRVGDRSDVVACPTRDGTSLECSC